MIRDVSEHEIWLMKLWEEEDAVVSCVEEVLDEILGQCLGSRGLEEKKRL